MGKDIVGSILLDRAPTCRSLKHCNLNLYFRFYFVAARCILGHMKQCNGDFESGADTGERLLPVTLLSIGQVVTHLQAEYPDVSHSSLRFLEREGLVTPHRTPGGHRLFTKQDVDRVRQIKRWRGATALIGGDPAAPDDVRRPILPTDLAERHDG